MRAAAVSLAVVLSSSQIDGDHRPGPQSPRRSASSTRAVYPVLARCAPGLFGGGRAHGVRTLAQAWNSSAAHDFSWVNVSDLVSIRRLAQVVTTSARLGPSSYLVALMSTFYRERDARGYRAEPRSTEPLGQD